MTIHVSDVSRVSPVARDTRAPTLGRVDTTTHPSAREALAAASVPHQPGSCPGYDRPGTARDRFRCPGCGSLWEHRAGSWQLVELP